MNGQSKVSVSTDGQWVFDGYRWWPIDQVPLGTRTSEGYMWDGFQWNAPTGYAVPPPVQRSHLGMIGGIIVAAIVAIILMVLVGVFLPA